MASEWTGSARSTTLSSELCRLTYQSLEALNLLDPCEASWRERQKFSGRPRPSTLRREDGRRKVCGGGGPGIRLPWFAKCSSVHSLTYFSFLPSPTSCLRGSLRCFCNFMMTDSDSEARPPPALCAFRPPVVSFLQSLFLAGKTGLHRCLVNHCHLWKTEDVLREGQGLRGGKEGGRVVPPAPFAERDRFEMMILSLLYT